MKGDEARMLLGFPPNSRPTLSQVKAAYRSKVWESHPDLFPVHGKANAESKFKLFGSNSQFDMCICCRFQKLIRACSQYSEVIRYLDECIVDLWQKDFSVYAGARREGATPGSYSRVVRTGVPRAHGSGRNHGLIGIPFLFIILGTVALGGANAARAYKKQKEAYPSHNPFLP